MFDIETREKGRASQSGASAVKAEAKYHTSRGRGSFRGRDRGGRGGRGGEGGGRGGGTITEKEIEFFFVCGESDHWSRDSLWEEKGFT